MKELNELLEILQNSIETKTFVKITLSKPRDKKSSLENIYVRLILIKENPVLSFNYHYTTNDQTKNFSIEEGIREIRKVLENDFQAAMLFTNNNDYSYLVSKKGTTTLLKQKPSFTDSDSLEHDRKKVKRTNSSSPYLTILGIHDQQGNLIPSMADKYRQINKYLEIIESLLSTAFLPQQINIVDMGSGKGYLTFALYDFLKNNLNLNVTVTGIELRKDLVDYCNNAAQQCGFDSLHFICQPIEEYKDAKIDILIALHACDTATDDAIYKGIVSNSSLIICAPCCHKQIRQQLKGIEQESPLLKYGIFKERQFEMVTDTIRALILEEHQYQTKIFEFISNEHTRKNVMLVGSRTEQKTDTKSISDKIKSLKDTYQIQYHYLEKLVDNSK